MNTFVLYGSLLEYDEMIETSLSRKQIEKLIKQYEATCKGGMRMRNFKAWIRKHNYDVSFVRIRYIQLGC